MLFLSQKDWKMGYEGYRVEKITVGMGSKKSVKKSYQRPS